MFNLAYCFLPTGLQTSHHPRAHSNYPLSDPLHHASSSLPAPTSSPEPTGNGAIDVGVAPPANLIQAEAALQRLQELQMKMVGGEQKGDEDIKDKRKKKMSHAMKRYDCIWLEKY